MSLLKAFIMSPVYNCLTQLHKLNGRYLYDMTGLLVFVHMPL